MEQAISYDIVAIVRADLWGVFFSSKDKTSELNIKYTLPEVNDDNKDKDYNIVVIQEFTPVVYDDQGNLIANWQQVYETE